jgi:hypothetical protein
MVPQVWIFALPLTSEALFSTAVEEHRRRAAYDDRALRAAVFQGFDPSGRELDEHMPRWSMGDGDWHDLLTFLGSRGPPP